jgi:pimeloyl-ACP methyl ester carboxylesterase
MQINETHGHFKPAQSFRYSRDVAINYESEGTGARSVLFLHGFAASIRNWDDIRAALPWHRRYFFLDLKGFGFSSKPHDSDYGLHEQAAIVKAFIADQNLGPLTLVGHSYGGGIALLTCLAGCTAIDSLILIDSGGYSQRLPAFMEPLRAPLLGPILSLIPQRWQVHYSLRRSFSRTEAITEALVDRYAFFYGLPGARESFRQAALQVIPPDHESIERRFSSIDLPTLIIWGRQDQVIPVEFGRRLATEIRDSRLIIHDPCGHVPQEEEPGSTAREITSFLGELQ